MGITKGTVAADLMSLETRMAATWSTTKTQTEKPTSTKSPWNLQARVVDDRTREAMCLCKKKASLADLNPGKLIITQNMEDREAN